MRKLRHMVCDYSVAPFFTLNKETAAASNLANRVVQVISCHECCTSETQKPLLNRYSAEQRFRSIVGRIVIVRASKIRA